MFGPTIQGEGSVIGQQTYFIRLGACDYRCKMCDSMHAVDPVQIQKNATWLTQEEIFDKLTSLMPPYTPHWVTLSGGNPCVHDLYHLCKRLKMHNWNIAVETQGTIFDGWLHMCDAVTVSPKSPGMGEKFDEGIFQDFIYPLRDHPGLAIKIVVFDREDLVFAENVFATCRYHALLRDHQFYLSQGNPYPPGVASWDMSHKQLRDALAQRYLSLLQHIQLRSQLSQVKFLPQFHVWLWGNQKGV